jgi:hypothetical protein
MKTFADKVIQFNKTLQFTGTLPPGIRIMNPFREDPAVQQVAATFYKKFYDDLRPRHIILGINPGRFGGGITGIPFTDPKRLQEQCQIPFHGAMAHEPSSVFVYEMINAFGGPEAFYRRIYINSICPLGFTSIKAGGKEVNYNYYDSPALTEAVRDFINATLKQQLKLGIDRDTAFCFGTGKNEKFLRKLNDEKGYFKRIIPLEHPRYIVQYKSKQKEQYIAKYMEAFAEAGIL